MVGAVVIIGVSLCLGVADWLAFRRHANRTKEALRILDGQQIANARLIADQGKTIARYRSDTVGEWERQSKLLKEKDERHALDMVNLQKLMGEYADSVLDIENRLTSLESSERMKPNAPRATVKNWKQFRSLAEQEAAQESN